MVALMWKSVWRGRRLRAEQLWVDFERSCSKREQHARAAHFTFSRLMRPWAL